MNAHGLEPYLLGGSLLLILSIVASKTTGRFGIPLLLVFLIIGMLAGSEGIIGIHFNNHQYSQTLGVIALQFILFAGGLETDWKKISKILLPGLALSTVGVLITCGLTGWFATYILGFTLPEGLLLGAIVSSTDAAAVFTILRASSVNLKGQTKSLLELESGSNDPMAVFLTIGILQVMQQTDFSSASFIALIPMFIKQMSLGAIIGYAFGKSVISLLNRIKLEFEGLYSVLMLAVVVLGYSISQLNGGNGFLSVYIMGIVLGRENFIHKKSLILFQDGIAWLMQIAMFLTLGLLVFPSKIIPIAGSALLVSAFLIFIARPVGVFVSLIGQKFSIREKSLISWIGLRGAVPIILATYPMLAGIPKAEIIFNIVFFIVLTSILFQGTSIPFVAKLLKMQEPFKQKFRFPIEYTPMGNLKSELIELHIPGKYPATGKPIIELNLPKEVLIVLIQRQGNIIIPKGSTHLHANDTMLVLAEKAQLEKLQSLLEVEG